MLFGVLNAQIFTVFSGPNRHLYEAVVGEIYSSWYRNDLLFPADAEIVGQIYHLLGERPELWREEDGPVQLDSVKVRPGRRLKRRGQAAADVDATSVAMARSRYIYNRLNETGWLEESRFGLKVTVDMPAGAMRLAELLCLLREGVSEELGGLVSQIRATLGALRDSPKENALALHKAARDAGAFGRYLRSVLSALREIDKQVLASESLEDRLRHYFEDFVERVLLKDYAAISTTSHPYRFRHQILASIDAIESSEHAVATIAEVYVGAQLRPNIEAARALAYDEFGQVRRVFDQIETAFERIKQHRGRLEARLRNTVRYAGRRGSAFLQRSERLLLALDRHVGREDLDIPGLLEAQEPPISPDRLAKGRAPRAPIEGEDLPIMNPDPSWIFRQELEQAYLERLNVRPEQVLRFLEQRVSPGDSREASLLWIETLDDFLAFEALRLSAPGLGAGEIDGAVGEALSAHFSVTPIPGARVETEWLGCEDFEVRRLTDHITLEVGDE